MSNQEHWPKCSPTFSREQVESLLNASVQPDVSRITVDDIVRSTSAFPIKFPINTVKCEYLRTQEVPDDILERNINSVYPILHETALPLFLQFLSHKKQFGSNIEKRLYKDFTITQLIDRLFAKRAVMFCGRFDAHMLLDGVEAIGNWETIGTDAETPPKILENYLSYDEIKLSALLSVSSYTYFINDGARANRGKYCENRETLEDFGVIIGLIGPRLHKPEVMEYQEIVVTKEQNVKDKGYGKSSTPTLKGIFLNFYAEPNLTYKQLKPKLADTNKYIAFKEKKIYFNINAFQRRLSLSIDTLLLEANERGREMDKMSYVFAVGIGLGVWRICSAQNQLFMDAFCKRIEFLGRSLKHVSDIYFSYIEVDSCGQYADGDLIPIPEHPNGGIKIHIGRRNPHTKLIGEHQGKLLVVSYAWDGNSLPGNEFWGGSLHTSSDPAAACSTQVAELHNRYINPKVSVAGLRIATLKGVETFQAYVEKLRVSA